MLLVFPRKRIFKSHGLIFRRFRYRVLVGQRQRLHREPPRRHIPFIRLIFSPGQNLIECLRRRQTAVRFPCQIDMKITVINRHAQLTLRFIAACIVCRVNAAIALRIIPIQQRAVRTINPVQPPAFRICKIRKKNGAVPVFFNVQPDRRIIRHLPQLDVFRPVARHNRQAMPVFIRDTGIRFRCIKRLRIRPRPRVGFRSGCLRGLRGGCLRGFCGALTLLSGFRPGRLGAVGRSGGLRLFGRMRGGSLRLCL